MGPFASAPSKSHPLKDLRPAASWDMIEGLLHVEFAYYTTILDSQARVHLICHQNCLLTIHKGMLKDQLSCSSMSSERSNTILYFAPTKLMGQKFEMLSVPFFLGMRHMKIEFMLLTN